MKFLIYTYLVMSLVTFCAYGLDKLKAKKGWWRIPESTLHLFEFAFGWPGAILAQKLFRHKTYKQSFRRIFWLMVAANILLVGLGLYLF